MPETFEQLGIPFPLFEAPVEEAREYHGVAACSLCRNNSRHCFLLGIGCAIISDCPSCGTENGLDANDGSNQPCRNCDAIIPFPAISGAEVKVCYECLRDGKAAITKDTDLGMISWEHAFEGVTHGIPGLNRSDFEMVPRDDDWVGARLPHELMFELLRTPTYITWQGERWQFCCRWPMVYVGAWDEDDFARHASDHDGRRLFEEIVQDRAPGIWEDQLHDGVGVYVFRCSSCGRMTAHWDID